MEGSGRNLGTNNKRTDPLGTNRKNGMYKVNETVSCLKIEKNGPFH